MLLFVRLPLTMETRTNECERMTIAIRHHPQSQLNVAGEFGMLGICTLILVSSSAPKVVMECSQDAEGITMQIYSNKVGITRYT